MVFKGFLFLAFLTLTLSCGGSGGGDRAPASAVIENEDGNLNPLIESINLSSETINDNQVLNISVTVTDPDEGPDALTFLWTVPEGKGNFSDPTSNNPLFLPPNVASSEAIEITLTISDGSGFAMGSAEIRVNDIESGATELLNDNFNDGDTAGWSKIDEGASLGPGNWIVSSGQLNQTSNIHTATGDISYPGTYLQYDNGFSWSHYKIKAAIKSTDNDGIGIMFRQTDADNYYRFTWNMERNFRRLEKKVGGIFSELKSDTTAYSQGQTYALEIVAQENLLEVHIDGALVFSTTDSDLGSGTIALYSWGNQNAIFDNVIVEDRTDLIGFPIIADFSLSPSAIFDNQSSQFSVNVTDSDNLPSPLSYYWQVSDTCGELSSNAIANPVFTPADVSEATNCSVLLQVTDGLNIASTNSTLTVYNEGQAVELLNDNFADNDIEGWSIVEQGITSAPSNWSAATGQLVQSTNIHTQDNAALAKPGTYITRAEGTNWSDYKITATMESADDDGIGIMVRVQDPNNYYRFSWDKQRNFRRLVKNVGGTFTSLDEDNIPYVQNQAYLVEIEVKGSNIKVSVDGSLLFDVTDSDISNGSIGLYSWGNQGSKFDDVKVDLLP